MMAGVARGRGGARSRPWRTGRVARPKEGPANVGEGKGEDDGGGGGGGDFNGKEGQSCGGGLEMEVVVVWW